MAGYKHIDLAAPLAEVPGKYRSAATHLGKVERLDYKTNTYDITTQTWNNMSITHCRRYFEKGGQPKVNGCEVREMPAYRGDKKYTVRYIFRRPIK